MASTGEQYESVKKIIRSILISAPNTLTIQEFCHDYKQQEGHELPFREFGYESASAFLNDCPDIASSSFNHGVHNLKGVADGSTKHIVKLVASQKKPAKKKSKIGNGLKFTKTNYNLKTLPAHIKNQVDTLLHQFPTGIRIENFLKAWERNYRSILDFEALGLKSIDDFFLSLPNLVVLNYRPEGNLYSVMHKMFVRNAPPFPVNTIKKDSQNMSTSILTQNSTLLDPILGKEFLRILENNPRGILASKFSSEYEKFTKKVFKLSDYGYYSVVEMAESNPEIFNMTRFGQDWILSEKNKHINSEESYLVGNELMEGMKETVSKKGAIPFRDFPNAFKEVTKTILPPMLFNSKELQKFINDNLDCVQFDPLNEIIFIDNQIKNHESPSQLQAVISPCDIVGCNGSYTKAKLPSGDVLKDEFLAINIGHVETPSSFWFMMRGLDHDTALENLMDQLDYFYNGPDGISYMIDESFIASGHVCAALYYGDNNWHRCVIKNLKDIQTVVVSYVDYGTVGSVKKSDIRYLKKEFLDLPSQAISGQLAYIEPINGNKWPIEAKMFLLSMVKEKCVLAKVIDKSSSVHSIILYDTSTDEDIMINDEMVNHGYAKFITHENFNIPLLHKNQLLTSCVPQNLLTPYDMMKMNPLTMACAMQMLQQPFLNNINFDKGLGNALNVNCKEVKSKKYQKSVPSCKNSKYVKRINLRDDFVIHVINVNGCPYITSGEISSFFWAKDNLRNMLRAFNFKIPCHNLDVQDNPILFKSISSYEIPGLKESESGNVKELLFMYPLESVPDIISVLKHKSLHLIEDLREEFENFSRSQDYWMSENDAHLDVSLTTKEYIDELKFALKSLYLERRQLIFHLMNNETMKGGDMLKQIEDQMDDVNSEIKQAEQNSP